MKYLNLILVLFLFCLSGWAVDLGKDENKNGVRDDIDSFITKTYGPDTGKIKAATQLAMALQAALIAGASSTPPTTVSTESISLQLDDAITCLGARFNYKGHGKVLVDLESLSTNTKERYMAYQAYNKSRSGTSRSSSNSDPIYSCK